MHFLENYNKNIVQYDLVNKFNYRNTKHLPALKKIVLSLSCRNSNLKELATIFLSLELVAAQKGGVLTTTRKSNILLKIRKGQPVGCKLVLRRALMYRFVSKLLIQDSLELKLKKRKACFKAKALPYKLKNLLIFPELEKNYYLFNKLPSLSVIFVTNGTSSIELAFLLKSLKYRV